MTRPAASSRRRARFGDGLPELLVGGAELVAPVLCLGGHRVPPSLGSFACHTSAGYATASRVL
ncbi:MAG: hypothetical protein M3214_09355, partial [Actinomycetota bacterium]|nr:hypothetical protein [Actinomycetota bacterium]